MASYNTKYSYRTGIRICNFRQRKIRK